MDTFVGEASACLPLEVAELGTRDHLPPAAVFKVDDDGAVLLRSLSVPPREGEVIDRVPGGLAYDGVRFQDDSINLFELHGEPSRAVGDLAEPLRLRDALSVSVPDRADALRPDALAGLASDPEPV